MVSAPKHYTVEKVKRGIFNLPAFLASAVHGDEWSFWSLLSVPLLVPSELEACLFPQLFWYCGLDKSLYLIIKKKFASVVFGLRIDAMEFSCRHSL